MRKVLTLLTLRIAAKNKKELKENLEKALTKIKENNDIIKGFFRHPQVVFGF